MSTASVAAAIRELEEALAINANSATITGDLGVAWLEKAKTDLERETQPGDQMGGKAIEALGTSLTYLNRGLAQDSNSLAALFNRALCFQYLRLPIRAQADWRDYLSKDSTSRWSVEAQHSLQLLEQEVVSSSPDKDEVLTDFLAAYDAGDEEKAWRLISVTRDDLSGTSISQQLLDRYLDASTKGDLDQSSRQLRALSYVGELEVRSID